MTSTAQSYKVDKWAEKLTTTPAKYCVVDGALAPDAKHMTATYLFVKETPVETLKSMMTLMDFEHLLLVRHLSAKARHYVDGIMSARLPRCNLQMLHYLLICIGYAIIADNEHGHQAPFAASIVSGSELKQIITHAIANPSDAFLAGLKCIWLWREAVCFVHDNSGIDTQQTDGYRQAYTTATTVATTDDIAHAKSIMETVIMGHQCSMPTSTQPTKRHIDQIWRATTRQAQ